MMSAFMQSLRATVTPRAVLWLNHVLSAEPMAVQRLRPHAGKCIQLQLRGVPAPLSWLPSELNLVVTPAGLFDEAAEGPGSAADLMAALDASNPAQWLADAAAGRRPRVDVAGDAAFAADVSWLAEHLRWDVQDDLARWVGDGAAVHLTHMGSALAAGLRGALQAAMRAAPVSAEPPPR